METNKKHTPKSIKEQIAINTDAYGSVIQDTESKRFFQAEFQHINSYLKNDWRIIHVAGTGISSTQHFNRGSFSYVIERTK